MRCTSSMGCGRRRSPKNMGAGPAELKLGLPGAPMAGLPPYTPCGGGGDPRPAGAIPQKKKGLELNNAFLIKNNKKKKTKKTQNIDSASGCRVFVFSIKYDDRNQTTNRELLDGPLVSRLLIFHALCCLDLLKP